MSYDLRLLLLKTDSHPEWNIMVTDASLTAEIIAHAESFSSIKARVARLADVLNGYSYQPASEVETRKTNMDEAPVTNWPDEARSVLVFGSHHPMNDPRLDWWERGNSLGNHRLMDMAESLKLWLLKEHGRDSLPLPYHVEKGGLFLKDAAVFSGLGIIGRNNLLLHPEWGPRIRLRSILVEGDLQPTEPIEGFSPCDSCDGFCQEACPVNAFPGGNYSRLICRTQIKADVENKGASGEIDKNGSPILVVKYCRACELTCPVGVSQI